MRSSAIDRRSRFGCSRAARRRSRRRCCARGSNGRFGSATRSSSTRPRTGSCTARRTCCRRSWSIDTADYLVVQALSQGMDRLLPSLTGWLSEILAPQGILARNDPKVRALEGLEQTVDVLAGSVPDTVVVREGPIEYEVDLRQGPEDRSLPRPAREPRRGGAVRARPAARLLQLSRRIRAPARRRNARRPRPSTSRRTPLHASSRMRIATG